MRKVQHRAYVLPQRQRGWMTPVPPASYRDHAEYPDKGFSPGDRRI